MGTLLNFVLAYLGFALGHIASSHISPSHFQSQDWWKAGGFGLLLVAVVEIFPNLSGTQLFALGDMKIPLNEVVSLLVGVLTALLAIFFVLKNLVSMVIFVVVSAVIWAVLVVVTFFANAYFFGLRP